MDYFLSGKLDEVYMIYTRMVNAMKMEAEITQLLPLPKSNFSVPQGIPIDIHLEEITMNQTI